MHSTSTFLILEHKRKLEISCEFKETASPPLKQLDVKMHGSAHQEIEQ